MTLSSAANANDAVSLALNDITDPCTILASVTVLKGQTSATFTIVTKAVTANFTETIWGNYGVTQHASFPINPAVPAPNPVPTPIPTPVPSRSGSLASTLGTPTFSDDFNYIGVSEASFLKNWVPQIYTHKNYAGAGSNFETLASNITFPVNGAAPCLCLTLQQPSASTSTGAEILSAQSFGYGTCDGDRLGNDV